MKSLALPLVVAAALGAGTLATAQAAPPPAQAPAARALFGNVCLDTNIKAALVGKKPGDLLASPQDVTARSKIAAGRLYRVAYATTGEAGSVVASCGLVAVPSSTSIQGVVAWSHGTVGLLEECQPSNDPAKFVGPMFSGIGAVTKKGSQQDGALVGMLTDGYAVVATDYPSAGMGTSELQKYVLGVPSALAVIDSARALTNNATAFGLGAIDPGAQLPLVTWGHSQGGGSALWAGQLASPYLSAEGDRTLNLAGVAALAPATQFTTSPGQPRAYMGAHLGDRDMYNNNPGFTGSIPFPIGAALFSYVTASWSQVQNATAGEFPFGPTARVSSADVLSPAGQAAAPTVAGKCLNITSILPIYKAISGFANPNNSRFFAAPFDGSNATGTWQGGIDATCDKPNAQSKAIQEWCQWLQFNMAGPNGVNPYPDLALNSSGAKVPVLLAQGRNDRIMWCVDTAGKVSGTNCLTDQFFHSLEPFYCNGTGYLEVDYFPGVDHFGVPAAIATNPSTQTFTGSALDTFVSGAMKGNLKPMCSADPDAS